MNLRIYFDRDIDLVDNCNNLTRFRYISGSQMGDKLAQCLFAIPALGPYSITSQYKM